MGKVDNEIDGWNEGCGTSWSEEAVWIKALEEQGERILEPVLALRVIREVSVTGCMSDEWAKYLEENLKEEEVHA